MEEYLLSQVMYRLNVLDKISKVNSELMQQKEYTLIQFHFDMPQLIL